MQGISAGDNVLRTQAEIVAQVERFGSPTRNGRVAAAIREAVAKVSA